MVVFRQLVLHVPDVSQHLTNNGVTCPSSLQLDNKQARSVAADRENVYWASVGWVLLTHPLTVLLEDDVVPAKYRLAPVLNEEVLQGFSIRDRAVTAVFVEYFPPCHVPKVVGLLLRKALVRITRARCRPGKVIRRPSSKARKNHVLAQSPKPGTTLIQGRPVNLTVGKGPQKK